VKATYERYESKGLFVLAVTIPTFATSDAFVASGRMVQLIEHDFMKAFLARLLKTRRDRGCIDYDFVIERSPRSHWNIYGLVALMPEAANLIWKDGCLCEDLAGDLDQFTTAEEYRLLRINKILIEPFRGELVPEVWSRYITKTRSYRSPARDEQQAAA